MCLWSLVITLTLIAFEKSYIRRYRGFKAAIAEQGSPLKP
jgi:hypothetical protein